MTVYQGDRVNGIGLAMRCLPGRATLRQLLRWVTVVLALAMLALSLAAVLAPHVSETLQPASISADGEGAFVQGLSLQAPWPYVVPSHPEFGLSSGDATLTQDGVLIGILTPSHDEVRRLGGGRFDFWQGTLWFTTTGPDPRDTAHSYTFTVKTQLDRGASSLWHWCGVALLILVAVQLGRAAVVAGDGMMRSEGRLGRINWRFRLPFFAAMLALLGALGLLALRSPLRLTFEPDSLAYVEPGLRLAAGQSMAGTSVRDLGYPLLTYVAVHLGSISDLVPLQLGLVLAAVGCLLVVMAAFFGALLGAAGLADRRVPVVFTAGLIGIGTLYVLMLFSHNNFVIDVSGVMAEAPHLLPMALALLCFAAGWAARAERRRIVLLAAATAASYASTLVKPSSLMAFALCAAGLAVACLLHRRELRSPALVAALVVTALFVGSLQRLDDWATARDDDFGARVLFCNHLDVIDGHVEPTTPERARIKELIAHVFSLGPRSWPLQGYDGDECSFSQVFSDSIAAAARSEGRTPKEWEMREFAASVLAHPLRYARHAAKQIGQFALHPIMNTDEEAAGSISDHDWAQLVVFGAVGGERQSDFNVSPRPWLLDVAPGAVSALKFGLKLVSTTFLAVAAASAALAFRAVARLRRIESLRAEVILLSVGAFTASLPVTVALSHSFDVGRYTVDILPLTLLWWWLGAVYLLRSAFRLGRSL